MKLSFKTLTLAILIFWLLSACAPQATPTAKPAGGIANPASTHCIEMGGQLEIRSDASGGQAGYCIFPDHSECEEWLFFRGQCSPGTPAPATVNTSPAQSVLLNLDFGPLPADSSQCQRLVVFSFKYAEKQTRPCGAGEAATARGLLLSDSEWQTLSTWQARFGPTELDHSGSSFAGTGSQTMAQADLDALRAWAAALLARSAAP